VHDTTVSSETCIRESGAIVRCKVPLWMTGHSQDEDERLARVLITSWTLITGRTVRADVPPHLLSEEELVTFWADDRMIADRPPPAGLAPRVTA